MSSHSFISRATSGYRALSLPNVLSRMQVEIRLKAAKGGNGTPTYSTRDKIEGEVFVSCQQDRRFDEVELTFSGLAKTFVDGASTVGRLEASHRLLEVRKTIEQSHLPQPRIFEAGYMYLLPFTFEVPDRLVPDGCKHAVASDMVRDAHLKLPPTLGDRAVTSSYGGPGLDDLAPEMSRIVYAIGLRITKLRESDGVVTALAERSCPVRILPALEVQPPMLPPVALPGHDSEYCLRREKGIRKGLFWGRRGHLVMETTQPASLHLPAPSKQSRAGRRRFSASVEPGSAAGRNWTPTTRSAVSSPGDGSSTTTTTATATTTSTTTTSPATATTDDDDDDYMTAAGSPVSAVPTDRGPFVIKPAAPVTTVLKLSLRYDPVSQSFGPPQLGLLCSRLKVTTFFNTVANCNFPARPTAATAAYNVGRSAYLSEMLTLSSRQVSSVSWQLHDGLSGRMGRLAPADADLPAPSSAYKPDRPFYSATILVPIALPDSKYFVPSFHSCLISRVYALDLCLSFGVGEGSSSSQEAAASGGRRHRLSMVNVATAPAALAGAGSASSGVSSQSISLRVPIQISSDGRPEAVDCVPELAELPTVLGRSRSGYVQPYVVSRSAFPHPIAEMPSMREHSPDRSAPPPLYSTALPDGELQELSGASANDSSYGRILDYYSSDLLVGEV